MMAEIVSIRFDDFTEAVPAFFTIVMMPLTYSIAQGLAFGFMSYTIVKLLAGRHHENNPVTDTLSVLFLLHFVIGAQR
jgi:AGZA family xanthine/uracil permease-like MFS transporter